MKDSHLEIERKFLIHELPRGLERYPHHKIEQGYLLAGAGAHVRLRRISRQHFLTYKRHGKVAREEREVRLTRAQFDRLWPATAGARLTKTRYDVPWKKRTIEIDIYRGSHAGLMVAEVEFPNVKSARAFRPPDWLGKDVTGSSRYSNIRLARD